MKTVFEMKTYSSYGDKCIIYFAREFWFQTSISCDIYKWKSYIWI